MKYRFDSAWTCTRTYLQLSTAHALRRSGWATRTPARIFWFILFILANIAFMFLLISLFLEYFKYPVKLSITNESLEKMPFPAVTICNMNPIRSSSMVSSQRSNIDSTISASHNSQTAKPVGESLEALAEAMIAANMGHFVNDTILYCAYDGLVCHPEVELTQFLHPKYGNCMTFNNDGTKETQNTGQLYGLRLMLYVNRAEDYGGLSATEGFRLAIHVPGSKPYPEKQGFALATGMEAEAAMQYSEMVRLEAPYSDCDKAKTSSLECATEGCLPPCKEIDYTVKFALTSWPSTTHNNSLQSLLKSVHGIKFDVTQMSSVKIYYQQRIKRTIAEEPHISFTSLLSQAGGLSGLCIGFSVLTVLEFIEMLASLCCGGVGVNGEQKETAAEQEAADNEAFTNEGDELFAEDN